MKKIIRITTIPASLKTLLKGQLRYVSQNGFDVVGVSSEGKELNEVALNEGVRVVSLNMTRVISPIKDIISLINLYLFLIKEKPDIIHTHTPKAGTIGMIASFLARVPVRLHTVAGLPLMEVNGVKRFILNFVEMITYFCATKVYPNSNGLKNIILDNKFTIEGKLKVIANGSSNGIDTSHFNPLLFNVKEKKVLKDKLNIVESDFVFVFVGRIVGDKGINELVSAFDKLCYVKNDIKLLLVGPYENKLDPLNRKTKLLINNNKKIISLGYQNDVRVYFSISNCLVFPSYREGFPNVVMQAGAMGLPSIVSDINGCNEIIDNNVNGLIVKVKSINAVYKAMLKISSDKSIFNKLRSNSRSLIKIRYERQLFWDLLLNEYKKLIN